MHPLNPVGIAYAAWLTLLTLLRLVAPVEESPKAPPQDRPTMERPAEAEEIMAP